MPLRRYRRFARRRTTPFRRRRFVRGRRSLTGQRSGSRKSATVLRFKSNQAPDSVYVKFKNTIELDMKAIVDQDYIAYPINASDLAHPWGQLETNFAVPMVTGFTEWAAFFERYTVVASAIKITTRGLDYPGLSANFRAQFSNVPLYIMPSQDQLTAASVTKDRLREGPYVKKGFVACTAEDTFLQRQVLSHFMTTAKVYGVKGTKAKEDHFGTYMEKTYTPNNPWFWYVMLAPVPKPATPGQVVWNFNVELTQYVKLDWPKVLAAGDTFTQADYDDTLTIWNTKLQNGEVNEDMPTSVGDVSVNTGDVIVPEALMMLRKDPGPSIPIPEKPAEEKSEAENEEELIKELEQDALTDVDTPEEMPKEEESEEPKLKKRKKLSLNAPLKKRKLTDAQKIIAMRKDKGKEPIIK